jgi:DNA-binding PadR family transcriptional regulator
MSDELHELHILGELSEKGYLIETYDNELDDLVHTITEKGRNELKIILKDPNYKKEFIQMAISEAKKHPGNEREIMQSALNKLKELE